MTAPASSLPAISAQRTRFAGLARERDPRGDRYNRAGAYQHGAGLGRAARKQAVDTAVGAVDDPLECPSSADLRRFGLLRNGGSRSRTHNG